MASPNNKIDTDTIIHLNSEYNPRLSAFLDAARWISALLVLITHLNNRMFVLLANIPTEDRNILSYIWGFICGFAHWGIVVFFVLSGFLVGGPILDLAINNKKFNAKKYLVARITRIYLVLIPVLIIGNSLDYLGIYLYFPSGVYNEHISKIMDQSIFTVIGSILNLQGIFSNFLGTNGPLYTLANEFWYYMTFPLILAPILYKKTLKSWLLFGLGICLLISMSLALKWHFVGFLLWCTGAIFAVQKKSIIRSPLVAFYVFLAALILIRLGVRWSIIEGNFGFIFEIIIAIFFGNILCSLKFSKGNWTILNWKWHSKLGGFSYSLYAIHVPLLNIMCAVVKTNFGYGWHDIPKYNYQWLTALIFLVLCISLAWALSLLTEKHTYRLRNIVNQKINTKPLNTII